MALTTKQINSLIPTDKRYVVRDTHGLSLRVYPSGTKTWVLRLSANCRVSDVTLGRYPEMDLKEARQVVRRKRREFGLCLPSGYTVRDAFRLWCDLKRGRLASYRDERRRLEHYVIDLIGSRQIDEVTAPLIIHLVRDLQNQGKLATLKRILMRVREIFDIAVAAGYVHHNPIERLSRVFAPPVTTPMASIHWQELEYAMGVMKDAPERIKNLWLWSCCSLLRSIETAKLQWDWIDGDVLTIPSTEMKKRRTFRVPLTDVMKKILEKEQELSPHPRSRFVFSGRKAGKHINSQMLTKYLHSTELNGVLVTHGLRSVGRSYFADNGIQYEVAEMCLSHVVGSSISRAYQRSDYLEARRIVMDQWCKYVIECAVRAGFSVKNVC